MKEFMRKFLKKSIEIPMWVYFKLVNRLKVEGLKEIPDGQYIYCANHRSIVDPPILDVTCGKQVRFIAKQAIIKNKFVAFLGRVFRVILVKRDSKDITALKTTLSALKNGESIAIFPEGTRNGLAKGEDVKDGAAFFTIKSGVPIVPVGISGKIKPFSKMKIKYGKPIYFKEYTDPKDKEQLETVTNIIMDEIIKLCK